MVNLNVINDGETAIVEMALASGLELLRPGELSPLLTTTYGTGQLLKNALEKGAKRIIIGIAAAFSLARVLAGFLFGVVPRDAAVFASVPAILAVVAFAAVWFPARRATRLDPIAALRQE